MCGIAGYVDYNGSSCLDTLTAMGNALTYRGPDDSGSFEKISDKAKIGLFHRRLSILDLSDHGHQPMEFDGLAIVYNGEIYNFKEVRNDLEDAGYYFNSNSDTEVALKAYHFWGIGAISRFNGMFSFAIFDEKKQWLTLVRDRSGVKPLYWYKSNGLILFASELKSFHEHPEFRKELNIDSLALFLQYGYVPQPHTIFKSAYKLRAGHYLDVDLKNFSIKERQYWDIGDFYKRPSVSTSVEDAICETENLIRSACEYRMVADVPVGVFLSGGYDSSTVAALLQKDRAEQVKTFSIGFHDQRFNEANHAKRVADYLGTDHTELYCTEKDAVDILPTLPDIYDEPFGDSSAIPTIMVSQLARKRVTVSLSADGGDEVFGGYEKYSRIKRQFDTLSNIPAVAQGGVKRFLSSSCTHSVANAVGMPLAGERLNRYADMVGSTLEQLLSTGQSTFLKSELDELIIPSCDVPKTDFHQEPTSKDWLSRILQVDYKTYLADDILTKVDRATMSVSLEGREPLLDHRLVEYVAGLESSLKIRHGTKKWLLKEIAHRHLPVDMMDRPKKGFGLPIDQWLRSDLKGFLLFYLDHQRIKNAGIFDPTIVSRLRDDYLKGSSVNKNKVWYLLVFEMWREKWL